MVVKELNYFYNKSDKCKCCGCVKENNKFNYCKICFNKKDEFINDIVGSINIGKEDSIKYELLNSLEYFRSGMINVKINRIIDNYFINQKSFKELYNDDIVISNIYKEKILIMKMVIDLVPFNFETCNTYHNNYLKYYAEYMENLKQMYIKDEEILKEITIKITGHPYIKNIVK